MDGKYSIEFQAKEGKIRQPDHFETLDPAIRSSRRYAADHEGITPFTDAHFVVLFDEEEVYRTPRIKTRFELEAERAPIEKVMLTFRLCEDSPAHGECYSVFIAKTDECVCPHVTYHEAYYLVNGRYPSVEEDL